MKTTRVQKLMISGISDTTNNQNELDENTARIPKLWDKYFNDGVYNKTFNKSEKGYMYGVYSDYVSNEEGDYKITIGIEVTKPKKAIVIENEKYLVFSKKGELPDVVTDAWQDVWEYFDGEPNYERAYKIDFEKYVSEDEIEIYISIL